MSLKSLKSSRNKLDVYFAAVSPTNFTQPSYRLKPKAEQQPTGSDQAPDRASTVLLIKLILLAVKAPECKLRDIVAYAEEHTEALSEEMRTLLERAATRSFEEGRETLEEPVSLAHDLNPPRERALEIPSIDFSKVQPYRPQANHLDDLFD